MNSDQTHFHTFIEELTDKQWAVIEQLIPTSTRQANRRGRPSRHAREVLNGILWVLRHNARWHDLPKDFPSYQTCHRRFQQWMTNGTMRNVLEALDRDLRDRGGRETTECPSRNASTGADVRDEEAVTTDAEPISWQQQTAMLFHSPTTLKLLRRLNSPLARRLSCGYSSNSGATFWSPIVVLTACQLAEISAHTSTLERFIGSVR